MQIFSRTASCGAATYDVDPSDTIFDLLQKVVDKDGYCYGEVYFVLNG
jgi:hypothetical protein